MPLPVADKPRCDVLGCGRDAVYCTDGSEVDAQEGLGRPALPYCNVCGQHLNWPHSEDATRFAATDVYTRRVASLKGK